MKNLKSVIGVIVVTFIIGYNAKRCTYSDDEDESIDRTPQVAKNLRYEIGEKTEGCSPGISCGEIMTTMLCTGKDTRPDLDLCQKSWHVKRSLCAKGARQLYHYDDGYRIVSVIYSRRYNDDDPFKCVEKPISNMSSSRMMIDCSNISVIHEDFPGVELPARGFFLLGSYIDTIVYGLVQESGSGSSQTLRDNNTESLKPSFELRGSKLFAELDEMTRYTEGHWQYIYHVNEENDSHDEDD